MQKLVSIQFVLLKNRIKIAKVQEDKICYKYKVIKVKLKYLINKNNLLKPPCDKIQNETITHPIIHYNNIQVIRINEIKKKYLILSRKIS